MKLEMLPGALRKHYRGQEDEQEIVADVDADGTVYVHANPEIGNAVPMDIWHGIRRRLPCPAMTKQQVRAWYRDNRDNLRILINGMENRWDGNNRVGTLTDAARQAETELTNLMEGI